MSTSSSTPTPKGKDVTMICKECHEPIVWEDDITAMRDGMCGDCQDD